MKHFFQIWCTFRRAFKRLFSEERLYFGEIKLLHGTHDISLPLHEHTVCTSQIREVWVSVDDRHAHIPICCGDSRNWFSVKIIGDEVRIDAEVNTDKVLLKWFILA